MKKIKCPCCGEEFKPTRSGYDMILSQIRTAEYNQEIEEIRKLYEKEKHIAIEENILRNERITQKRINELKFQVEQ